MLHTRKSIVNMSGKVYKIVDNTSDDVYVGSTILSLKTRLSCHKSVCKRSLRTGKPEGGSASIIINRGDFRIELLEEVAWNEDLQRREGWWILNTPNVVNDRFPLLHSNDSCLLRWKSSKDGKPRVAKSSRAEYQREYRERMGTELKDKERQYAARRAAAGIKPGQSTEIRCGCGVTTDARHLWTHARSATHVEYVAASNANAKLQREALRASSCSASTEPSDCPVVVEDVIVI